MGNVFNKFGGGTIRVDELFTGRFTTPGFMSLDLSEYKWILVCVYGGAGVTQSPVLIEVGGDYDIWGGGSYNPIYDSGHPSGSLITADSTGITVEHGGIAIGSVYGLKGLEKYKYIRESGDWYLKLVEE